MKKRNKIQWALMLAALPFLATAAASAHQWISANSPIDAPVIADGNFSSARVHNIVLNRNGGIEGRVTNIDGEEGQGLESLKVYFVRNGEIANETTTDENGKFHIDNMIEGAYSFVATGENGFAAYGVNVVAHAQGASTNIIEAAAVSPSFSVVQRILRDNLPAEIAQEIIEGSSNITDKMVGSNRIKLSNGTLTGHLVPLFGQTSDVEGTHVHIIQGDKQIAEVEANASGAFSVSNLEPGVYDFVAAGPTGIAAVSFQAIDDVITASSIDSDEIPVAIEPAAAAAALPFQDVVNTDIPFDASSSLDVCLTCQNDAGFVGQQAGFAGDPIVNTGYEAAPIEYASEAVSLGGACGGTCGAAADFSGFSSCNTCNSCCGGATAGGRGGIGGRLFGGRLGGTGLRRLALLGGIAGAVVAIATDDDDQTPGAPN